MKRLDSDIRVYVSFFGHAKRKKLQRRAGHEGIVCLFELWAWASIHRPNGDLTGLSNEDIALSTNWSGEPDDLIDALVQSELMDGTEGNWIIHDYAEEQPHIQNRKIAQELGKIGGLKAAANMTDEERKARAKHAAESRHSANPPKQALSIPLDDSKQTSKGSSKPCPALSCPDLSRPDQLLEQEGSEDIHSRKPAGLPTTKVKLSPKSNPDVQAIYDFWREVMNHESARLSQKRIQRIEWALKLYGFERAKKAIIGCASKEYNRVNGYDDLELIFRNESKFEYYERFAEKAQVYMEAGTGKTVVVVTPEESDFVKPKIIPPGCDQYGHEMGVVTLARQMGLTQEDMNNVKQRRVS